MAVSLLPPMPSPTASYAYPIPLSVALAAALPSGSELRKRTTSFSCPTGAGESSRPRKLHRTDTIVDLTSRADAASTGVSEPAAGPATPLTSLPPVPYKRTLKYQKEQSERRKAIHHRRYFLGSLEPPVPPVLPAPEADVNLIQARIPLCPAPQPAQPPPAARTRQLPTSPLAQHDLSFSAEASLRAAPYKGALVLPPPPSSVLACGPAHPPPPCARMRTRPKSKVPVDLHRRALTACMRASPEGAKILHMGPRLAVMTATRELERMCASDAETLLAAEGDEMGDADADSLEGEVDEEDVAAVEAMVDADVPMPDADMDADADAESDLDAESEPEPEPVMSASWVVVSDSTACGREIARGYGSASSSMQREDWEMVVVECAA